MTNDEFPSWSLYTEIKDNPVYFVDPTGMTSHSVLAWEKSEDWAQKMNRNDSEGDPPVQELDPVIITVKGKKSWLGNSGMILKM